ncbi:MAG: sodium:solute symporter family protein [Acidimicrobiia bacterium]|nr:sodium:solute symporter family protein [Acidimicrobiia bacterium]
MTIHLALLIVYSVGVVALGLWTSRLIRSSSDFFVAGRRLGPGLIFASMLAANIGSGATVGVAGLAYAEGISAWWWSGSAGLASLVLAFRVGPRIWALANEHGFYTTGDFLEFRYNATVRLVISVLILCGTLAILAGQIIAGAAILNVLTGAPRWVGSLIGGAIMTIYFAAGGLLGTAVVNTVQLVVMLAGFLLAMPVALGTVGGLGTLFSSLPAGYGDFTFSTGPGSGWTLLFLTGPAFIVSPGLIQKSYGARSGGALRTGVALNAAALMVFAFVPVLLGMVAAVSLPGIQDDNLVLPTLLREGLPVWLGALALAAVFSTEVDTCDAILFMISTSASKDLYKRHVNPGATDAELLRVARIAAIAGGTLGVLLSIYLATVIDALTIFYSLLVASLFVPFLGGLYTRRAGPAAALAAIVGGVVTLIGVRLALAERYPWVDPTLTAVIVAAAAFAAVSSVTKSRL